MLNNVVWFNSLPLVNCAVTIRPEFFPPSQDLKDFLLCFYFKIRCRLVPPVVHMYFRIAIVPFMEGNVM